MSKQDLVSNPWHLRKITVSHEEWYSHLQDYQAMTLAFLEEFKEDVQASPDFLNQDRMDLPLAPLPESLKGFLDETSLDDVLIRLETAVQSLQAWVVHEILKTDLDVRRQRLEKIAQQMGRNWTQTSIGVSLAMSEISEFFDLRKFFLVFQALPLRMKFLPLRSIERELKLELIRCPHEHFSSEAQLVADDLCALHTQWMYGMASQMDSRIRVEYQSRCEDKKNAGKNPGQRRCGQRWYYF